MSEPASRALRTVEIAPGMHRWKVLDDRIGGESDAFGVAWDDGLVLIDPLPIAEEALRRLGKVDAIVLTAACHQRSAWRFRRLFGARVHAPEGTEIGPAPGQLEEEPDHWYGDGARLPGGLQAVHAPGPARAMFALWLGARRAVFVSDLLTRRGASTPTFIPAAYQDDPRLTRTSVRRLIQELPIEVVCFNHGPPILRGGRRSLERALLGDRELLPAAPAHPE